MHLAWCAAGELREAGDVDVDVEDPVVQLDGVVQQAHGRARGAADDVTPWTQRHRGRDGGPVSHSTSATARGGVAGARTGRGIRPHGNRLGPTANVDGGGRCRHSRTDRWAGPAIGAPRTRVATGHPVRLSFDGVGRAPGGHRRSLADARAVDAHGTVDRQAIDQHGGAGGDTECIGSAPTVVLVSIPVTSWRVPSSPAIASGGSSPSASSM